MSTSEQLEREAEASRESISYHLDELRSRMTAGEIVDQVMDYARNGTGGQFAENLRRQVVNNPLPVALIGAGISWLLMSGSKAPADRASRLKGASTKGADFVDSTFEGAAGFGESLQKKGSRVAQDASEAARDAATSLTDQAESLQEKGSRVAEDASDAARETASSLTDKARSAAEGVSEYAQDAKSRLRERVGSAGSSASETFSSMSKGATERLQKSTEIARETTSALRQRAVESNRQAVALVRDQPLILVGLGLAVGSILGALLPGTKTEDQLMGEASDDLKASGAEVAEQQVDNLKTTAEGALGQVAQDVAKSAKDQAARLGSSDGTSKQSRDPADMHTLESPATVPTEAERENSDAAGNMSNVRPGRS